MLSLRERHWTSLALTSHHPQSPHLTRNLLKLNLLSGQYANFCCAIILIHDNIFSSYIYFSEDTRATHVNLPIYIGSVPAEHLDTFNEKLKASLQRIVMGGIDMQRMGMVINRDERQVRKFVINFKELD